MTRHTEEEKQVGTVRIQLDRHCLRMGDKQWHQKKETITPKCIPALCMAGDVLLKTRNKHVSKVQSVISLVLNAGHVGSQVGIYLVMKTGCGLS